MSRRTLQFVDSLGRTGVASQVLVLAEGLLKQGWDVHVAALGGGPMVAEYHAAGVPAFQLGRRWAFDPIAYARLRRLFNRSRPQIVHSWGAAARQYAALAIGKVSTASLFVSQCVAERPRFLDKSVAGRLNGAVQQFVVTSSILRDWYARCGIPAEKLLVIPPGVTPAAAGNVPRETLLRELSLPASARLIGVVGRLVPENRVQDLIWAADLLRVLHDNLRLLVIGDGPLRPQLEQYARLASDLDHIRFLGERADVGRIMPHLDVLWNASQSRGLAMAILEAMAAGVPVVASDTPFNRELVIENETGYLIPLGTRAGRATRARHTDRIFTDTVLAARLSAGARRRAAECFSAERMVQQYLDLYAAVA